MDAAIVRPADPLAGGPRLLAALFVLALTVVAMQAAFPIRVSLAA